MEALLADEENQSRRTFCQLSFGTIYDNAERGQTSVSNLLHFFERQSAAQRKHAETMLEYVNDVFKPTETNGIGELANFEEQGTSIKRTLGQLQQYALALHTQQLVWTQVVDEHVTRPLSSLQSASSSYIQTLENEIVRVNEEYSMVQTMQIKVNHAHAEAKRHVAEAKDQQRRALHEIGVPSFELQRLAARVTKCERALREANEEKVATKKLLLAKIVARDEMAMAVSVAYQRAEEERMDQIASCLKMWVSVERDQLKFREAQLRAMDELVTRLDRSADLQLLIHNRQNPDNMHFQGKALSILEWHWERELHQAATTTTDDPLDEDELDAANIPVAAPSLPSVQENLSRLFESSVLSDESDEVELPAAFFDDIAQWCATHEGRLEFVKTLNRQRSVDTKLYHVGCFRHLVMCFDVFFDACAAQDDIKAAKTAMMLAATFYHVPIEHRGVASAVDDEGHHRIVRKYVQEDIKHHVIWRNAKFWEKALLLAIGEELHKAPQEVPWEELPTNVPRSHGVFTREEAVSLVHNIVFGQLGSFTLSMLELDVPIEDIRHFIETMCDAHELTEDQRFILRANLRDIVLKGSTL